MSNNNLKIKNVDTISNTTSSLMPLKGGYLDATSSFMQQKGGYLNNNKNKDINQYQCDSATSESNYTTNSTNTELIKNKLLNILQDGGGKEDYDDLIKTLENFETKIISSKLMDYYEPFKVIIDMNENGIEYLEKIRSILNEGLDKTEIINFLGLLNKKIASDFGNSLTKYPLLIFIYHRIISNISNLKKDNLEESTHNIRILLYNKINKIKKIYDNYLTKSLEQIDDLKKTMIQNEFVSLYTNLKSICDDIENSLLEDLMSRLPEAPLPPGQSRSLPPGQSHSLPLGPEQSRSAPARETYSARPSSSQETYSAPSQPRSAASTSSSARAPARETYSARPSSSRETYSALPSSSRETYSALPSSSRETYSAPSQPRSVASTSSAAVEKYNKQVKKLTEMMGKGIITSEEYFDTKLALSSHAYYNLIPINMKKSILDAIASSQSINGVIYYFDTDRRLFSIHPNHKRNYELVGPIYQRRYL